VVPIGGLVGGALGEPLGLRAVLVVAAAGFVAAPLWLVGAPARRLRERG
jgi:hypothetical protein